MYVEIIYLIAGLLLSILVNLLINIRRFENCGSLCITYDDSKPELYLSLDVEIDELIKKKSIVLKVKNIKSR